jgi:hypothetical protein
MLVGGTHSREVNAQALGNSSGNQTTIIAQLSGIPA